MSEGHALSVIVPAHNEARSIARLLLSLTTSRGAEQVAVIVVCNGCTDDTADRARATDAGVRVIETPVASKPHAVDLGLAEVADGWVALVDADIDITADHLLTIVATMKRVGALAGGPRRDLDVEGSAHAVRSYYRFWQELPAVRTGLFGRGVIVLSPSGRSRVGSLADVLSDDLVISDSFAPGERVVVETARSAVIAPRKVQDLMRRRIRVVNGVDQAEHRGQVRADSRTTMADLLRVIRASPARALDLPAFLGITIWARRAGARSRARGQAGTWHRDESSRR